MFSLELAAFIAAATCAAILTRQLLFIRKYPTAPGPSLAVTSRLWYLCKVWQGHFETWNIEQHALHGKILRVAPNWYSIDDVNAMKPIYGLQTKMVKSDWYLRWGEPGSPGRDFFSAVDPVYHSQLRRRFAQMYSMTTMRSYEPFVSDCTAIVLEKLDVQASSGEIFNLQFWMQCYAFDNAGAITYSVPAGFVGSDEEEVHSIIDKIDAAFSFSVHYNIYNFLLPFLLVRFGRFDKFIDLWTKRLDRIRKNTKINNEERNAEDFSTKLDALRAKDPAAAQHYRDHTLLIANMTAGSDTTGITLTAIFFYLTKYPNTLEKLRFVIKEARAQGKMSTPVTFEESQKLPYLQYVIKESMRLFPGTGLPMWRVVQKPGETIAGTFFPPGAVVGINSWVAHYNESVYGKDARTFRPDRWDPAITPKEQLECMEQYYLPFGAGTRTCVGRHMAILQMSKLIPEIVMRYDFELMSQTMKTKNHWFVKQEDVMVRVRMIGSK